MPSDGLDSEHGKALRSRSAEAVLRENYAGIVDDSVTPEWERVVRIAALVPSALQVVDEARDTIARLRDEVDELRRQLAIRDEEDR